MVVVQYDASVEGAAFAAVKQAQEKAGITHLDIVVANAAIVKVYPHVKEAKRSDILEHFSVNALGPVELFQATRDLLEKSADKPKFVFLGSGAGALG